MIRFINIYVNGGECNELLHTIRTNDIPNFFKKLKDVMLMLGCQEVSEYYHRQVVISDIDGCELGVINLTGNEVTGYIAYYSKVEKNGIKHAIKNFLQKRECKL